MLVYPEIVRYAHFGDKIYNDITHYLAKCYLSLVFKLKITVSNILGFMCYDYYSKIGVILQPNLQI